MYCIIFLRFFGTCAHFTVCYFFGSLVRVCSKLYTISFFVWYVCSLYCMLFIWFVGALYVISTLNNEDEANNTAAVYNAVQFINSFITVAWCNFVPVSTKSKNSPYFSTTPIPLH